MFITSFEEQNITYRSCSNLRIHITLSDIDSIGLADSNYAHIEYWKVLQSRMNDLKYIEYEEIPRGRAIFNSKLNKLVIYLDKSLLIRSKVEKISQFYEANFEQIIIRSDPHYRTK